MLKSKRQSDGYRMRQPRIWLYTCLCGMVLQAVHFTGCTTRAKESTSRIVTVAGHDIRQFVRDKYGIPGRIPIAIGPLSSSVNPAYFQTTVDVDDDYGSWAKMVSISRDGTYFVDGEMYRLGPDTQSAIQSVVREVLHSSSRVLISVGPLKAAEQRGFDEVLIRTKDGHMDQVRADYVTSDKRFFVVGGIYRIRTAQDMIKSINMTEGVLLGPPTAALTIAEYVDYQCPTCAISHRLLRDYVLPRYRDRVRIAYKDAPLPFHEWAVTAAVGLRCVYEIDPGAVGIVQSAIFADQWRIDRKSILSLLVL